MKLEWEKIREVYNLLGDDISKNIFTNRILYSFTGERKYIRDIISLNPIMSKYIDEIYSSQKPLAIFGAGTYGKKIVRTFDDIQFVCFIDNCITGSKLGLPVFNLDSFLQHYNNNCRIVIATKLSHEQIYNQMIDAGISHDDIINLGVVWEKMTHEQYLDLPEFNKYDLTDGIFVDAGCYDGMTSIDYIRRFGNVNILAWEPDPDNVGKCINTFREFDIQYRLVEKGMWDTEETLTFKQDKTDSAICTCGGRFDNKNSKVR